jgi:hypothetical protein
MPSGIRSDIQFAAVAAAASDNTLVAAVTARKIRLMALALVASGGANNARLESGAGGTALTGVMNLAANGQLVLPYNAAGWWARAVATREGLR